MPLKRPTLKELATDILADVKSRLELTAPILRKSLVGAISRAQAGQVHGLYGALEWMVKQAFVHLCDGESLDYHGAARGIPRKGSAPAVGRMTFTGKDGVEIPAGTRIQYRDKTREYIVSQAATAVDGIVSPLVTATKDGVACNLPKGSEVTLLHPIPGLLMIGRVAAGGVTGGADVEEHEKYRERILDKIRNPPHGGNPNDFKQWALEVPGVSRAWVFKNWSGIGTVGLMFAVEGDDPIPNDEMRIRVQAHIDSVRPVIGELFVFIPELAPQDYVLWLSPDTRAVRMAVEEELRDYLARDGAPDSFLYPSRISEAISGASGEHHHNLVSPVNAVRVGRTQLPVLGRVEYQSTMEG